MKFSMLPQPVGLWKPMLNLLSTRNIFKGDNSGDVIFLKRMFDMVMCQDTCKPVCFKLGMMLYATLVYRLIPV